MVVKAWVRGLCRMELKKITRTQHHLQSKRRANYSELGALFVHTLWYDGAKGGLMSAVIYPSHLFVVVR